MSLRRPGETPRGESPDDESGGVLQRGKALKGDHNPMSGSGMK
jgi:hypothetical protein